MTSEEGSFAQRTIVERKPQIISQVIRDNNYPPSILRELDTFAKEIATQPMSHLSEQTPDASVWNQSLVLHEGKTWLEVPWYLAEAYFYRRLLEAIRYLELPPGERKDPFEKQKRRQERAAVEQLAPGWHGLATLIAGDPEAAFEPLLHSCLWGNRADLSNYTVKVQAQAGLGTGEERYNILIDHTDVTKRILTSGLQRVDFVNDNVGMELFFDLALTDFLLVQGFCLRRDGQRRP